MIGKPFQAMQIRRWTIAVLVSALVCALPLAGAAQETGKAQDFGIAAKRPVLQAACRYCPWGVLGDVVKNIMAPYGYEVAICYSCSGVDSVRIVSRRLVSAEISDRQFAEGTLFRPEATIDFGITQLERVRSAYEGTESYQKRRTRSQPAHHRADRKPELISWWLRWKSSGITDLKQIRERKMPVRIMMGVGGGVLTPSSSITASPERTSKPGAERCSRAMRCWKNPNFDLIMGVGILANYPEGNMWYEMTRRRSDLVFFPIPEDLRQKLAKENRAELVELPFRYMRGVGDTPPPDRGPSPASPSTDATIFRPIRA